MEFRKWLMREMAHIAVPNLELGGRAVSMMDMMFEKYPLELHPMLKLWMWHFCARLPDGRFLQYRSKSKNPVYVGDHGCDHQLAKLPGDWLDYARISFADGSVREPLKP